MNFACSWLNVELVLVGRLTIMLLLKSYMHSIIFSLPSVELFHRSQLDYVSEIQPSRIFLLE